MFEGTPESRMENKIAVLYPIIQVHHGQEIEHEHQGCLIVFERILRKATQLGSSGCVQ